jgi:pimeloyl-ACP methyl ester carboxylesterase
VKPMADLPYIVFDVNDTLLDLETLQPTFERIFGDKLAMRLWFVNLILYPAALTVANSYVSFTDIGAAVMKMLADVRGVKVSEADRKELIEKFSTMPPHSDREAGSADAPVLLLLHGFPISSHMFRDLIPLLADRFRLVAPDLPGFGRSDMPQRADFAYSFDHLAGVIDRFTEATGLMRFAVYVFDYGSRTGFRIAAKHPERITAIISQNGNAYEEGSSDGWNPIRTYWQDARRPIETPCAPSSSPRRRSGNIRTMRPTRRLSRRTDIRSTTTISPAPAPMTCSSICSGIIRPRSRFIRPSKAISARTSRPSSRRGARRPLLSSAGRRGFQTRHSRRRRSLFRHRPLRAGDPRCRDRIRHTRLSSPLSHHQ